MTLNRPSKTLLAVLSGILNILVFPKPSLTFLSWVCLVPLLVAAYQETKSSRAFFLGQITGLVFFFGTCRWIMDVLHNYGDLGRVGSCLCFLLLAGYLSLFYAGFLLVYSKVTLRFPRECFIFAPFLWVATEFLRGQLLTGFPWCLLGYGLVDYANLAQMAKITGVYGLSFVLVLVNALVAASLLERSRNSFCRLLLALVLIFALSGTLALTRSQPSRGDQLVRIVQTDLSPDLKWDVESRISRMDALGQLSLSEAAEADALQVGKTRLLIWPETPAPFYFNQDPVFRQRMQALALRSDSYVLFGFVDYKNSTDHPLKSDPFNSAALLNPAGQLILQYDKIHLVPFGEYVPFERLFFFIEKISTEAGNFRAGEDIAVCSLAGGGTIGGFICYEAIFPELVRRFTRQGAQVLFNLTNDAWFGDSAAPYQHLNMARLRAIENHRYLLRAANSGISAVIDPEGRIVKSSRLNERVVLSCFFDFDTQQTVYTRWGDWFAWSCLGISLLVVVRLAFGKRNDIKGTAVPPEGKSPA